MLCKADTLRQVGSAGRVFALRPTLIGRVLPSSSIFVGAGVGTGGDLHLEGAVVDEILRTVIGPDDGQLTVWNVAARAVVIYLLGLALVRLGEKRFIGKFAAFDVILGFMLGSILSRAVTGNSPFFPTLAGAFVLVLLHYTFAALAFHTDWVGTLVKGHARTLVADGEIDWTAMRRSHISRKDLMSALRENGRTDDVAAVRLARLERSGNISVILRDD